MWFARSPVAPGAIGTRTKTTCDRAAPKVGPTLQGAADPCKPGVRSDADGAFLKRLQGLAVEMGEKQYFVDTVEGCGKSLDKYRIDPSCRVIEISEIKG